MSKALLTWILPLEKELQATIHSWEKKELTLPEPSGEPRNHTYTSYKMYSARIFVCICPRKQVHMQFNIIKEKWDVRS